MVVAAAMAVAMIAFFVAVSPRLCADEDIEVAPPDLERAVARLRFELRSPCSALQRGRQCSGRHDGVGLRLEAESNWKQVMDWMRMSSPCRLRSPSWQTRHLGPSWAMLFRGGLWEWM